MSCGEVLTSCTDKIARNRKAWSSKKLRSHSSSVAEDARWQREKVFRLRSDKPLHRPRDPMSLGQLVWNCSGFYNWTILLLVVVAVKMFLENLNKFGVLVDPTLWFASMFGELDGRREYPALFLAILANFPLLLTLKTEQLLAKDVLDWSQALSMHLSNLAVILTLPVVYTHYQSESLGVVSSLLLCTMYAVLFMKIVSFIQVNKWCRESQIDPNNNVMTYRSNLTARKNRGLNNEKRRRFYSQCPDFSSAFQPTHRACDNLFEDDIYNPVDVLEDDIYNPVEVLEDDIYNPVEVLKDDIYKSAGLEMDETGYSSAADNTVEEAQGGVDETGYSSAADNTVEEAQRGVDETHSPEDTAAWESFDVPASVEVVYPDNLTVSDIYYFWFAPTLCYEINFPKTRSIRKSFLLYRAAEVFIGTIICMCIVQQYIVPSVAHTLIPFSNMEISLAAERLLKLALPNHLVWLISFYLLFHSALNSLAELLQFADRSFFRDWWNAGNLETFWKTWNLPVHRWCVRHVYKPLLSYRFSPIASMFLVFLLSAILHEYLVSVPLRMFKIWCGLGMLAQVPLVLLSRFLEAKFGPRLGNMTVWLSLVIGQPLIIMIYYHDFVVQHYGSNLIEVFGQLN